MSVPQENFEALQKPPDRMSGHLTVLRIGRLDPKLSGINLDYWDQKGNVGEAAPGRKGRGFCRDNSQLACQPSRRRSQRCSLSFRTAPWRWSAGNHSLVSQRSLIAGHSGGTWPSPLSGKGKKQQLFILNLPNELLDTNIWAASTTSSFSPTSHGF